jgi:hypothetical protein
MQSLGWYFKRLSAMSPSEIAWRIRSIARDQWDRPLVNTRIRQRPLNSLFINGSHLNSGFRICDLPPGPEWDPKDYPPAWRGRLIAQADLIAAGKLSFFDQTDCDLGQPINWNRDPKRDQPTPAGYAADIDYRDVAESGDCKFVWEPSRHHQMVVLARAYRVTGDERYAASVITQITSWLDQCPFGHGMQWRSPLELGIRLINWIWAYDLIRDSESITSTFAERFIDSVHRHAWEIRRKYSQASSANNHLIGEAAGVYVAMAYFANFKHAERWRIEARNILCREILIQSATDGGTREQALGYQLFVLQFYLVMLHSARQIGEPLPESFHQRLAKMLTFIGIMSEGGDQLPLYGDDDSGYVLDLGEPRNRVGWLVTCGALLLDREDLLKWGVGYNEPAFWLAGPSAHTRVENLQIQTHTLASHAFNESGLYLLQCGRAYDPDRISVTFDCGELGYGSLAAHGHADALSFTLRAFGIDIFVDPGTYDYFSYPEWRAYFRSTRAHNTVVVDGLDQSEPQGLFLWGQRANCKLLHWEAHQQGGGTVIGMHDGYARLSPKVEHSRTLHLDPDSKTLLITDEFTGCENRTLEQCLHLGEACQVTSQNESNLEITAEQRLIEMTLDPRLSISIHRAQEHPIAGWVSRGYHQKRPSTTIIAAWRSTDDKPTLKTRIKLAQA